jgi:hypothetical protein
MMGLPCLRLDGAFFASCDRRSGDLLVKLPETCVGELIEAGTAHAFAPAGRHTAQSASTITSRPAQPGCQAFCADREIRSSVWPNEDDGPLHRKQPSRWPVVSAGRRRSRPRWRSAGA